MSKKERKKIETNKIKKVKKIKKITKKSKEPKQKNIALVLGGGLLQLPIIRQAKEMGYRVFIADKNINCQGAALAEKVLPSLSPSDQDIQDLLQQLQPFQNELALCLTVGTDFSLPMAHVNETFSLPGIKIAHAKVTTHKGNMRRFLRSYNFNQPDFFVTNDLQQAKNWLSQNNSQGYVIKPTLNMGARGVMFFKDVSELPFAFEYAMRYSPLQEVIIEDFILADEFSIDALVLNGEVYECGFADRIIERKDNRFFIENGHTMPSVYPDETRQAVISELQKFADALYEHCGEKFHGALKGDIRFTEDKKIFIGEIASRLSGGFMSTHTYPMASGNNLMAGLIEVLEGKIPSFIKNINSEQQDQKEKNIKHRESSYRQTVIERSLYADAGKITRLTIPPAVENNTNLKFFHLNYQEGDFFSDLQNNVGKVGHFVIQEQTLPQAEKVWQKLRSQIDVQTQMLATSWQKLRPLIKKKMPASVCYVCKECDGEHCASGVPGMGAVKDMRAFRTNLKDIAAVNIIPNYLIDSDKLSQKDDEKKHLDISFSFAGKKFSAPIVNAPITGSVTNLGGAISEWELACEIGMALHSLNLLPFFGDGASDEKFYTALAVISQIKSGVPFFKPREDLAAIAKRIELAEKAGATAWGMDIDSVTLATMKNKNVKMSRKSLGDLLYLKKFSSLPFVIKGILTTEDVRVAAEAGASAIVVSNHGGRIINSLPSAVSVLPAINEFVKNNFPHITIFADGGVRSGEDIYKFLFLGADAVSIGRPFAIAAVGGGRTFVGGLALHYKEELVSLMKG